MKGILTLKKSAMIVVVCLVVLCLPCYSEPTPEQVKERTELLLQAIENNDVERAKICIKLGADVNAKVYISRDSWGNERETTNKDDPYIRDKEWGSTLLIKAVYGKSKDIVELFIKAGADVNVKGWDEYPVIHAVRAENKDALELLIKSGADVNAKDKYGWTVLLYALNEGLKDSKSIVELKSIAELLIKLGADVNAKSDNGRTVLMSAANRGYNETVELLIKSGADVNAKSDDGWTALMFAAGPCKKDTVELLIKSGADVNAKSDDGWTALMRALDYEKKDTAELLINAGADSRTALVRAVKNYNGLEKNMYNEVKLLIELGADVNATDSDGLTLLTHAILYGKKDIADLLRAAGATE